VEQRMNAWGSTAEELGQEAYSAKVEQLVQCSHALLTPCAATSLPLSICGAFPAPDDPSQKSALHTELARAHLSSLHSRPDVVT
jgi:hypothetical protein